MFIFFAFQIICIIQFHVNCVLGSQLASLIITFIRSLNIDRVGPGLMQSRTILVTWSLVSQLVYTSVLLHSMPYDLMYCHFKPVVRI